MNNAQSLDPRVEAYLERIQYTGLYEPGSAQMLRELQEHHLQTVPYENLDILRHVPLSLEITALFDKIVTRRRGGYCFELNALFRWLLEQLGYSVTSYFARFWRDEPTPPPKRRHHVLRVEAEGEFYLCDVGVGGVIPRQPIKMVEGLKQRQGDECYRLDRNSDHGWMLSEFRHNEWNWLYSFTEEPQLPKDFLMATYWCEHSPDSIFTKDTMVSVHTPDGRNTVAGKEFRIFRGSQVESFTPVNSKDYEAALAAYFGIRLT